MRLKNKYVQSGKAEFQIYQSPANKKIERAFISIPIELMNMTRVKTEIL